MSLVRARELWSDELQVKSNIHPSTTDCIIQPLLLLLALHLGLHLPRTASTEFGNRRTLFFLSSLSIYRISNGKKEMKNSDNVALVTASGPVLDFSAHGFLAVPEMHKTHKKDGDLKNPYYSTVRHCRYIDFQACDGVHIHCTPA